MCRIYSTSIVTEGMDISIECSIQVALVSKYSIVVNEPSYGLIFKGDVNHFMMCDAGQLLHKNVIFLNRCGLA